MRAKISEKGGVSVYGLGQWPVTLYASQWERLLDFADELRKFISENSAELSRRAEASKEAQASPSESPAALPADSPSESPSLVLFEPSAVGEAEPVRDETTLTT